MLQILTALSASAALAMPAPAQDVSGTQVTFQELAQSDLPSVRFATFNAFLNRNAEGELIADLSTGDDLQARAVAEIIQINRPDVILLNEFDFDPSAAAINAFRRNYLNVSQGGQDPIVYPYVYLAPSNTGIPSGFDLNNDGQVVEIPGEFGYGDDSFGFGNFPGHFGMVVLSTKEILYDQVRTFQTFRWIDMPGALLPDDAATAAPADFYAPEELEVFRLSSKSHWDVPVRFGNAVVHVLCAHPTPPVFDGAEDRNGRRNHDEIRFWADYVTPGAANYIYDDAGQLGGLNASDRFVILGDYNADPLDGDGVPGAIAQLLDNPLVIDSCPTSLGGLEAAQLQAGVNLAHANSPAFDTGDFTDASKFFVPSGNLRADYVLAGSRMSVKASGVFWPAADQPHYDLVGAGDVVISSDHRLVWSDLVPRPTVATSPSFGKVELEFLGEATLPTGLLFEGTEVGGLSALVHDSDLGIYLALSDDRGSLAPPRYYTLELALEDGALSQGDVTIRQVVTLFDDLTGQPFLSGELDPEGLALTKQGTLFLASEGDVSLGIDPFVNRFGVAGQEVAALEMPAKFLVGNMTGIRNNLAFESLTLSPQDTQLFTATENALFQDGPAASLSSGSPCRILSFDPATGFAGAEYVYITDPVAAPTVPKGDFSTNGLVELLSLETDRFLAMERSFSVGVGNAIRIYDVDTKAADDVSAIEALEAVIDSIVPVTKSLVLDLDALGLLLDNVEGMTFGPVLPDGRRTLVLVSDNNFSSTQFTQFLAFAFAQN